MLLHFLGNRDCLKRLRKKINNLSHINLETLMNKFHESFSFKGTTCMMLNHAVKSLIEIKSSFHRKRENS